MSEDGYLPPGAEQELDAKTAERNYRKFLLKNGREANLQARLPENIRPNVCFPTGPTELATPAQRISSSSYRSLER